MTKEEKKNYVLLSRRRYGELTDKKDKVAFLDQFCAMMSTSRKNEIRRLSPQGAASPQARPAVQGGCRGEEPACSDMEAGESSLREAPSPSSRRVD